MKEESLKRALESLKTESAAISQIAGYLDMQAFSRAVEVLSTCPKIITCASGTSGIAARKFAHSLCCIERNAQFLSPAEALHGGMGCIKEGDAVVIISRGGKTAELLPLVGVCEIKGAVIITLTENINSYLAEHSQIVISLKIEKECDKYNVMATSSFVATIAVFDALLVALMEETGYRLEQFSLIHPGGAVGLHLNKEKNK